MIKNPERDYRLVWNEKDIVPTIGDPYIFN